MWHLRAGLIVLLVSRRHVERLGLPSEQPGTVFGWRSRCDR